MAKPKYYVLICGNKRPPGHPKGCCQDRGSLSVREKFAEILEREQLYEKVKIILTSSCLGPCLAGPTVCVMPDDVWYGGIQPGHVEEIFQEHLKNGKVVTSRLIPKEMF